MTNSSAQDYPAHVTAKSVIGIGLLSKAAIGRKLLCNAAFLLPQCAQSSWAGWAGAARPPVRFPGRPTCSVPPASIGLVAGGSFNEHESEHIMTKNPQGVQAPVVFSFNSLSIRAVTDEHGNPWFVASDVCNVLGYRNSRDAIKDNCKEAGVARSYIRSGEQRRQVILINEGNLYRLIIKSKKPEAEKFERLVMEEILPAIRKTGSYSGGKKQITEKPANHQKRYHYQRALLEQPYFTSEKYSACLSVNMLTNTKKFISPLFGLLNELRVDGHDVSGPLAEAHALREALIATDDALNQIWKTALEAQHAASSQAKGYK
ncbi:MAG: hypothetical protein JSR71_09290 [Proteobacteria bacterium]|nr:hypothetical protein [Pseudomonadota bacterium]